jgi:ferredoxin-NADP reductase
VLHSSTRGNPGLVPEGAAHPVAAGFRSLAVTAIDEESKDVLSLTMQGQDGRPLSTALPGQYVVVRLRTAALGPPLFHSYSLSGAPSCERYRISVKIAPNGAAGIHLREHVRQGDTLEATLPRGTLILRFGERPVVLLRAGIGATPSWQCCTRRRAPARRGRSGGCALPVIGAIIHSPLKSAA